MARGSRSSFFPAGLNPLLDRLYPCGCKMVPSHCRGYRSGSCLMGNGEKFLFLGLLAKASYAALAVNRSHAHLSAQCRQGRGGSALMSLCLGYMLRLPAKGGTPAEAIAVG